VHPWAEQFGDSMANSLDILITGGTGYTGTALVPRLLARNHRIRVLARVIGLRCFGESDDDIGRSPGPEAIAGALRINGALRSI
jgi:nucleoside-diphosphate-sugar epimerase